MAKKCYAIRKGIKVGIVDTWEECQSLIKGFSGAEFRGFNTVEEVEAYMRGEEVGVSNAFDSIVKIEAPNDTTTVNLYTDGSYKDGVIAFGIYIEARDRNFRFYGAIDCKQYANLANIAGELLSVLIGVQLASKMGFTTINIIYDQTGVESWYSGSWRANGELQVKYATLMKQLRLSNNMNFSFIQVKGHSGVFGNTQADSMAKRGRNFKSFVDLDKILTGNIGIMDVPLFQGL